MPRAVAPPPSGEFEVRLIKPFSGAPTHTVEVIGEPNRSASIKIINHHGSNANEKKGDVPADDVQELLRLVERLRGYPSNPEKDIYGANVKIEYNTFEIQWASDDSDSAADVIKEIAQEQKDEFKDVADSIDALARTFAKKDSAV
ncbi:hypothetical protein B0A51_18266 [Rachicladosporium sp. CCFEE 5018]|nr:hypothetical protein B0A51_18266 [Rachicladosporium sp. CCFEE 5018]